MCSRTLYAQHPVRKNLHISPRFSPTIFYRNANSVLLLSEHSSTGVYGQITQIGVIRESVIVMEEQDISTPNVAGQLSTLPLTSHLFQARTCRTTAIFLALPNRTYNMDHHPRVYHPLHHLTQPMQMPSLPSSLSRSPAQPKPSPSSSNRPSSSQCFKFHVSSLTVGSSRYYLTARSLRLPASSRVSSSCVDPPASSTAIVPVSNVSPSPHVFPSIKV